MKGWHKDTHGSAFFYTNSSLLNTLSGTKMFNFDDFVVSGSLMNLNIMKMISFKANISNLTTKTAL